MKFIFDMFFTVFNIFNNKRYKVKWTSSRVTVASLI